MEHGRHDTDIAQALLQAFKNVLGLGNLTGPGLVPLVLLVTLDRQFLVDRRDIEIDELPDPGCFRRITVDRRQVDGFLSHNRCRKQRQDCCNGRYFRKNAIDLFLPYVIFIDIFSRYCIFIDI